MIPKRSIRKFIDIYKQKYGVELTEENAIVKATALIRLYKAIFGDPFLNLIENNNKNNDKQ